MKAQSFESLIPEIKGWRDRLAIEFSLVTENRTYGKMSPRLKRCDVPLCVNPGHLFVATQMMNVQDMVLKGRNKPMPRKLTDDQIRDIKKQGESPYFGMQTALARKYGVSHTLIRYALFKIPQLHTV